ncbi:hypothetical protein Sbal625DRAFT_4372 [Shewanella baltica OS625]|uniref:virulence factor TspB C-terminal domain-related protein n=1 Tax=Shewanella baltica TaxID=62322 RepID=UPI000230E7D7|nr:virulence factor TspB C-terminal domain-related protein [Shewanella baltica]EHC03942.1 hypothetical protein Sbal625DRAFT_4372 [Shewanella baltica OS625]
MDIRSLGFSRCCQAIIFLIASFPAFSAYTPPATPNLPLYFEFVGLNAEAEANEFRISQCDSDNFSWYSTGLICAVGDPTNPTCSVWMAYHSTDVNQCQTYVPPEVPEIPQVPYGTDEFVNGSGNTSGLMEFFKARFDYDYSFNTELSSLVRSNRDANTTTNSLLQQMNSLLGKTFDNSNIVNAINSTGRILELRLNDIRDNAADKNFWRVRHQLEDFNFSNQMGGITSHLTELNGLQSNIQKIVQNTSGSGSGQDYSQTLSDISTKLSFIKNSSSYLEGLSNSIDYAALDIVAGAHSDSDKEQALLTSLNESIASLQGSVGDSSKNIVDAIGDIPSGGTGADPDAISETGCSAFTCTSNTPECYIARKAWERSCAATKNEADAQGLVDSLTASLREYNDSEESDIQNIDAGKVDTSALMNHYSNGNGFSSGGSSECPAPYVVDVVISTITIDLSPFCQLAAVIKWFVIAFATVGAGLMIAKYT